VSDDAIRPPPEAHGPQISDFSDPMSALLRARVLEPPDRPGIAARLDRFEVLRLIGSGGMGVILLVQERGTSRQYALKTLKPAQVRDPYSVRLFLREARHIKQLDHPNIVRVLEVSDRLDGPYFIMPYVERGSLADLLKPGKPLEAELILSIARQVATALAYAHERGVIHRDLKPANVLVDGEGQAYVADFGLARALYGDSTLDARQPQRVGTAPYISPGVAAGKAEDTRGDVYSFGALLYEMLTGQRPYDGLTTEEVTKKILSGPPPAIAQLNPSAPSALVTVAEGAMARELRDRYASMRDVVADLECIVRGAHPMGPHREAQPSKRKRRRSSVALFVLAAALAVFAAGRAALPHLRKSAPPQGLSAAQQAGRKPDASPVGAREGQTTSGPQVQVQAEVQDLVLSEDFTNDPHWQRTDPFRFSWRSQDGVLEVHRVNMNGAFDYVYQDVGTDMSNRSFRLEWDVLPESIAYACDVRFGLYDTGLNAERKGASYAQVLFTREDRGLIVLLDYGDAQGHVGTPDSSPIQFSCGTWYHVVLQYDASTRDLQALVSVRDTRKALVSISASSVGPFAADMDRVGTSDMRVGHYQVPGAQATGLVDNVRLTRAREPASPPKVPADSTYTMGQGRVASQRDFRGTGAELRGGEHTELEEAEAAFVRAKLLSVQAAYRLRNAGRAADLALCDSVIAQQVAPAVKLVEDYAEQAKNKAEAYNALGDLYMQESGVLLLKWHALRNDEALARLLDHKEEADQKKAQALGLLPQIAEPQRRAASAHNRAMALDPQMEEPRLAIATYALSAFVPNPDRAKEVLQPIIKAKPDHREARRLLAGAAALAGDYDGALEHIRAARQNSPEDVRLLLDETQILVEARRWDEARPLSEKLLELQPNDLQAGYLRARVLLQDRRFAEAVDQLQRVLGQLGQPWPQAVFALAEGLRNLDRRQGAIAAFQQFFQQSSEKLPANVREAQALREMQYESHLALAQYLKDGDAQSAADHAAKALVLFPDRIEAFQAAKAAHMAAKLAPEGAEDLVLIRAADLLAKGDLDGAMAFCQAEVDQTRTPTWGPRVRLLIAQMLVQKGSYLEAAAVYEKLQGAFPDNRPAYELANIQERLGQLDSARKVYEGLLASEPRNSQALAGLFRVLDRSGRAEEAQALLRRVEKEPNPPIRRDLLWSWYQQQGMREEAIAVARSLAEAEPANPSRRTMLAEMLWVGGKLSEARAAFDEAQKLAGGVGYWFACRRGLLELQDGKTEAALEWLRDAQQRYPQKVLPGNMHLGVALQAAGQPEQAIKVLEKALEAPPDPDSTPDGLHWRLAVLYAAEGDAEKAMAHDRQVRHSTWGPIEAREELLQHIAAAQEPRRQQAATAVNLLFCCMDQGFPEAAVQKAELVQKAMPGEPLPRCWQAQMLDNQRKHQEAVAVYEANIRDRPDCVYARTLLADSYAAHGETESEIRVLEETILHAAERQAAEVHLRLGQLYDGQGRTEMAATNYEAAMTEPGLAAAACNNLAYLVATRKGDATAALPLAEQAFKLGRGSPAIADTLGWVHFLKGDAADAVKYLEIARKGLPGVPTVRYHLATAYAKAGRTAEARAELEAALAISGTFPESEEAAKLLKELSASATSAGRTSHTEAE